MPLISAIEITTTTLIVYSFKMLCVVLISEEDTMWYGEPQLPESEIEMSLIKTTAAVRDGG